MSDCKLSGFKPSIGMMSLAKDSQAPAFPEFFNGNGKISLAESSSLQHVFEHESFTSGMAFEVATQSLSCGEEGSGTGFLIMKSIGTAIFVRRGGVGLGVVATNCGVVVGFGVDGGGGGVGLGVACVGGAVTTTFVVSGVGFLVVAGLGTGFGASGITSFGAGGGSKTVLGGGGGDSGSSDSLKTRAGGFITICMLSGARVISEALQPSGKKYLMFSLRCSSSLKLPTNEAFLKV